MRQFNFISIKLTFYLIIGIVLGFYLEPKLQIVFIVLLALLLLLGVTFKKQSKNGFPFFGAIAALITVVIGTLIVSITNPKNNKAHYSNYLKENKSEWIVKVDEVLKPSTFSKRYVVNAKNLNENQVLGKLILSFPNDSLSPSFKVDDELIFFAQAKNIGDPLNPHQFDYQDFLKKKRIYHQLNISDKQYVLAENPSRTFFGYAANFRASLIKKLKKQHFGKEELAIIQALLLGQRNDISEETYNNYKNAGAVHILAVSGLHIGILLLLLQFTLKPIELLPKGKTVKLILIVGSLWAFAFIAGLSASIVRAVTMFTFLAYAMHLNRPTNTFNTIALSMFFILLIEPLFLFQVGFQMSYAAVIAIVWIYPKLQRFWYPNNIVLQKGWQLFSVSIAAQLGVLPVSLFYFHQFPALFFISNLVVIPFLGIILGLGILVLLLTSLNLLPEVLVLFYDFLIKKMNSVIEFVAQQESFVFRNIPFDKIQLILGYFIILGMITTLSKPNFKRLALLLIGVIAFQSWVVFNQSKTISKEHLILAQETANTLLLKQEATHLEVYGTPSKFSQRILQDYKTGEHIDSISISPLQNNYSITSQKLYVMDSLGVFPQQTQLDYLVLTQSPKINLERLLDSVPTKKVIADGSNYKSYIARWKATCIKRKLPFHYTGEKGAYYFE
ncbi:ComEC/Rec2 family competence protein [Croceitalea sp. MTPC9]|uniref:ComEC/Rec2 family competence protein n=1 Tax=unclassified Croceitalea TaxID=2632280 RepID=UPI002B3B58F3|nr:ComEC/Rec2 family competence protein [Croceitalea sp. MTPC6]GMN17058.1 ComEC/Rec2 family competence protein [Croceitalea sp. MTPC9]